jgi:fructose-1,6-bisphosphatase/inositol monophosphatase family enzyme
MSAITDPLDSAVIGLMRHVAARIIMPRFRALGAGEVDEKSPGEVVTIADRESEAFLFDGLTALIPGARIVGEEASDSQPEILDGVDQGTVWLVDPLDGTRNFAAGVENFAVMVALVRDGITEGGWILHPVTGRLFTARRGGGAFIDGAQITARTTGRPGMIGALPGYYAAADDRSKLGDLGARLDGALPGLMCAGADYPRCIDGTQDFAMFWRSMPWDHAPGALIVTEAGGRVGWLDGQDYTVASMRPGLMAAASPEIWDRAATLLQH